MVAQRKARQEKTWPRRALAVGLAAVLLLFLPPLLLLEEEPEEIRPSPTPEATLPVVEPPRATPVAGWDEGQTLRFLNGNGEVDELTMAEYLWGVVAAEMPASFQPEALKAQAVAARTYCIYQQSGSADKHPGADVCGDHTCCQAYLTREQAAVGWGAEGETYAEKITAAVRETDGLLCLYEGAPIDAVFFSSSAGKTSDAVAVWGAEVPYLTSVDSPEGEEVPGWQTRVDLAPADFKARFQEVYPTADLSGPVEGWVSGLTADETGMVTAMTVGGVTVSGIEARGIFGLRSAHFTVELAPQQIHIWVTGYGHGVGMSQYGANALAGQGKDFREILEWYYTGATVAGAQ